MYGIFTYIYHKNHPNVGKYTSPMDPIWELYDYTQIWRLTGGSFFFSIFGNRKSMELACQESLQDTW